MNIVFIEIFQVEIKKGVRIFKNFLKIQLVQITETVGHYKSNVQKLFAMLHLEMCQFPPISYSFEAMPVPAVATKGSTAVECYIKPHIRITVSSHNKFMYSGYSIHLNRFNNELLFSSQYNHAASVIHSQQVSLLVSLV